MKIKKLPFACFLLTLAITVIWLFNQYKPILLQKTIATEDLAEVAIVEPLLGSEALGIVFVDAKKYPLDALAKQIASIGMTVAVVDIWDIFNAHNDDTDKCLDDKFITTAINEIRNQLHTTAVKRIIISGIDEGALIPFINAQYPAGNQAHNLSIGFSVNLPTDMTLCPPLSFQNLDQNTKLVTSSSMLKSNWRSVWTDEPPDDTAVFIKDLGKVDSRIAPYDTPMDQVLIDELKSLTGKTNSLVQPMPVVEMPVEKPSTTLTLFYSGDGGWRDLDRSLAQEMTKQGYPVVGVDVLRYFWQHKSPELAAADLVKTMAYYRTHWGINSFVLAGYSFGADILPALYNRLPKQDQDSIPLMVLLAFAKTADFEIHVSGWLGQGAGEINQSPELAQIPKNKMLCVYGVEEKTETACTNLLHSEASILELPGAHHFDQDYPKLSRQILDVYRQHGIH